MSFKYGASDKILDDIKSPFQSFSTIKWDRTGWVSLYLTHVEPVCTNPLDLIAGGAVPSTRRSWN